MSAARESREHDPSPTWHTKTRAVGLAVVCVLGGGLVLAACAAPPRPVSEHVRNKMSALRVAVAYVRDTLGGRASAAITFVDPAQREEYTVLSKYFSTSGVIRGITLTREFTSASESLHYAVSGHLCTVGRASVTTTGLPHCSPHQSGKTNLNATIDLVRKNGTWYVTLPNSPKVPTGE